MHSSIRLLTVVLVVFSANRGLAAENCFGTVPNNVQKLSDLPLEIRTQLGADTSGMGGIADKDARFNATDVIIEPLPLRRFRGASVSDQCAVVSLEYGGIGHRFGQKFFEYTDGHWREVKPP